MRNDGNELDKDIWSVFVVAVGRLVIPAEPPAGCPEWGGLS